MSGMTDTLPPLPAAAAAQLDDQTVHVWHLGYRRAAGRLPLLRILAAYLGVDADELQLTQDAHGRGIGYGLQRLRVAAPPQPLQLLRFDGEDVGAWQLQRLDLAPELVAALAWRGSPRKVRAATLLADIE